MVHVIPLIGLHSDEKAAKKDGDKQPGNTALSLLHRDFRRVEGKAAGNEEDRVDPGEQDRQLRQIGRRRPGRGTQTQHSVAGNQPREEHGFGGEKDGHAEDRRALRSVVVG